MKNNTLDSSLETVACPFCNSKRAISFRKNADIVKCLSCSTVYLRSRLNKTALNALYSRYEDEGSHITPPDNEEGIKKSGLRRNVFMNKILEYTNPEGILLDIGCGWGAFLDNARDNGFQVMGFELTQKGVDFANNVLKINVSNKDFLEAELLPDSISVVTILHVLEHLSFPKESLKKVFDILKPDGIFFGCVPNIDSFCSDVLQENWLWIDAYYHNTYFSFKTLEKHLLEAGFLIEEIWTNSGDYPQKDIIAIIKNIYQIDSDEKAIQIMKELNNNNKGEEIKFIARKVKSEDNKINNSKINTDNYNSNIVIDINSGQDYEAVILKHLLDNPVPLELTLKDDNNLLPEYSNNWNGINVVRNNEIINNKKDKFMESINKSSEFNYISSDQLSCFSSKPATGVMPNPLPSPLKLNLGCGNDVRDEYINIDLFSDDPRVVCMDVRKLLLPNSCVDSILAYDILQHFSHLDTDTILKEWARVLKPGAELILKCPSIFLQAKAYMKGNWDADQASIMIYGTQSNPGDYTCAAFDRRSIQKHLAQSGFITVHYEELDANQNNTNNLNMLVIAKKEEKNTDYNKGSFTNKPNLINKPDDNSVFKQNVATSNTVNTDRKEFSGISFDEIDNTKINNSNKEKNVIGSKPPYLNLIWEGSQLVYHSLALINREQCSNIIDSKLVELTIIPFEKEQFLPDGNEKYEKLVKYDIRFKQDVAEDIKNRPYIWIRHQWPPNFNPPEGSKWIINQPWEYSQLRKDFAQLFAQADEIWTPSNYSRKCMLNSGLDFNKVQVIPNGINPDLYTPNGDKYYIPSNKKLKLLYIGGTIYRKGIDVLLDAYLNTFTSEDNICLFIKDMGGDSFYKNQTAKQTIKEIQNTANTPEIHYYDEYMTEEQMANLYRSCDAFVCSYRGEGFSLPTLEAMACGLPVIVTQGGSTDDFVDDTVGWLIPSTLISIGNTIDSHELTGEAFILEPDKNQLVETFKSIYNNPFEIAKKGINAMKRARTQWTWKLSTIKIFERIDALYNINIAKEAEEQLFDEPDDCIVFAEAEELYLNSNFNEASTKFLIAVANNHLPEKYKFHAYNRIAEIDFLNNDLTNANTYLDKVFSNYQNHPDSLYIKAHILMKIEKFDEALDVFTLLFDNWKDWKFISSSGVTLDDMLCDAAECFIVSDDIDGAIQLYTQALKYNSNNAFACLGVAKCFIKSNISEEAINMLEWAVRLNPDLQEAVELLEEINDRLDNEQN